METIKSRFNSQLNSYVNTLKPDCIAFFVFSCAANTSILRISDSELARRKVTPPILLLFESRNIHSAEGDKWILATDSELITLFETPKSNI